MKNFKKLICITNDGSSTIFLPDFNEYYHSKYGAVSESEHVFIKNGLYFWKKRNPNKKYCNIFEVGFGTGLNAFLTFKESKFILRYKTHVFLSRTLPFKIIRNSIN